MQFPKVDKVSLTDGIKIPQMVKVHQHFANIDLDDPVSTLNEQLAAMDEATKAGVKGKKIGISAGSRGVPFYKEMMKLLCDYLKEWGADPFIFPAMGSHANGDAEGQKALLSQFGINEEYLGVPVLSSMEVVTVATLDDGFPVYCDKYAYESDGIILFNKVKPHTHFKYKHESGLLKMICIGVGKHMGAATFHAWGYDEFGPNLERVSKAFLEKVNVVFSVGLVQSPTDKLCNVEVIPTDKLFERDAALLEIAKEIMPRLKLPRIDVLIVDEVGKEISGAGIDPNVVGRTERDNQQQAFRDIAPDIEKIILMDISPLSHGAALGMGFADLLSYRFVNHIDFAPTYTNIIAAKSFNLGKMPLYGNDDEDTIKLALAHSFLRDPDKAKIVRIKNTLMLEDIECSVGCLEEIAKHDDIEVMSEPYDWKFDEEGNLVDGVKADI